MRLEPAARRLRAPALTALVDVVFILLFFFMLAARPPAPRALELRVDVPGAGAAAAMPQALILGGARVGYRGQSFSPSELATQLRAERAAAVRLHADPQAQLQDLVSAFDALRAAGIAAQLSAAAP
ncbi:MAG: ExbD/TolR family protein [Gammaproteobacteria bacterium]